MRQLLGRVGEARLGRRSIGEGGNASALHWLMATPIAAAYRAPPTHFRLCRRVGFPRSRRFLPSCPVSQSRAPEVTRPGFELGLGPCTEVGTQRSVLNPAALSVIAFEPHTLLRSSRCYLRFGDGENRFRASAFAFAY